MPDAIEGAPRTLPANRRSWFDLGRGLRSAFALQRHPDESATRSALKLGFHDRSSLARHLKRIFGHTLSWIRPRLGWEWLLDDWCRARLEPVLIKPRPAALTPGDLKDIVRGTYGRSGHATSKAG